MSDSWPRSAKIDWGESTNRTEALPLCDVPSTVAVATSSARPSSARACADRRRQVWPRCATRTREVDDDLPSTTPREDGRADVGAGTPASTISALPPAPTMRHTPSSMATSRLLAEPASVAGSVQWRRDPRRTLPPPGVSHAQRTGAKPRWRQGEHAALAARVHPTEAPSRGPATYAGSPLHSDSLKPNS